MSRAISICRLSNHDACQVLAIAESCGLGSWSENDYILEFEKEESIALGAFVSEVLMGFIVGRIVPSSLGSNSHDAEIYNIGVRPDEHRKGVGRMLMQHFLETALINGAQKIWLEVRATNFAATEFYKSLGFTACGTRKAFYSSPPGDAVLMMAEASVLHPTISKESLP